MTTAQGYVAIALLAVLVALQALSLRSPTWVYRTEVGTAAKATMAGREGWEVVSASRVGGDEFAFVLRRPE